MSMAEAKPSTQISMQRALSATGLHCFIRVDKLPTIVPIENDFSYSTVKFYEYPFRVEYKARERNYKRVGNE